MNVFEGEGHYLTCYEESTEYNPYHIEWSYGKDLGSLEQIQLKEMVFDYSLDRIYKDQAGFYTCKFLGGKGNGWKKLFHVTVNGKASSISVFCSLKIVLYFKNIFAVFMFEFDRSKKRQEGAKNFEGKRIVHS